jgi:branched-chain amino acid aminotransferase
MIVFLNGAFVPEEQAVVSVFDRSFCYGDGLFETILVANGKMFRWAEHMDRLERSATVLQLSLPSSREEMFRAAQELIVRNALTEAVLRLQVSRGTGPRGYAPTGAEQSMVVMTLHPAPPRNLAIPVGCKLTVCSMRIAAHDPLAGLKSCSRLLQVLAATEARARQADEALLVNTDGDVTEGSTSNLFWIEGGTVCTPPLSTGALAGVTRGVLREICATLGLPWREKNIDPEQLRETAGVFLSVSTRGVVEAESLDGETLHRSPLTKRLQEQLEKLIVRECG